MKDKFMQIAANIAEVSGGRIRLAFNEDDDTTELQPEAAHFLKLDGKRIGRDIEVYGFMARVSGNETALADFCEVILAVKSVPESYRVGVAAMKTLGREVYPPELIEQWDAIFETKENHNDQLDIHR